MVVPNNHGFPTKNDHFGVFWGYHHLRKHRYNQNNQGPFFHCSVRFFVFFSGIWVEDVRPQSGGQTHLFLQKKKKNTLQGINISHLGKRKIIFKMPFLGDMLVFPGGYSSKFESFFLRKYVN